MSWQTFWKWLSWSGITTALVLLGAIWIVDPYNNLPFSPPLKRVPMASNQRFSYPAIARNQKYDSLVVGTSTARLLRPEALNQAFDARFANLSMNSATAYEQSRLVEVFARNRTAPKTLLVGLDVVWCEVGEDLAKYTFRPFPEWMYDDTPWNDVLHMLEFKTFEVLIRKLGYLLGLRESRYGEDGYKNFLPPVSKYDLGVARKKIYGPTGQPPKRAETPLVPVEFKPGSWNYPGLVLLQTSLSVLPADTRKVLVFVPYHQHYQPDANTLSGAQMRECKIRVAAMAKAYPNSIVLDFMIPSPITKRDENYWDPLHYRVSVADKLAALIAEGAMGAAAPDGEYLVPGKNP